MFGVKVINIWFWWFSICYTTQVVDVYDAIVALYCTCIFDTSGTLCFLGIIRWVIVFVDDKSIPCWGRSSRREMARLWLALPFSGARHTHGLAIYIELLRSTYWKQHQIGASSRSYLTTTCPYIIMWL